jgi:hypothetical protein
MKNKKTNRELDSDILLSKIAETALIINEQGIGFPLPYKKRSKFTLFSERLCLRIIELLLTPFGKY